jgi:hypothetical protein
VQEALHREAIERAVELHVSPLRITQVQQAGHQASGLAGERHLIDGRVVLHLQTWLVRHLIAALGGGLADPRLAEQPGQRRIADLYLFLFTQLLVHALHPAVALTVEALQQFAVYLRAVAARSAPAWAASFRADNAAHGIAADGESPGELAQWHALFV